MRDHEVTALTGRELEQARRELAASLAWPGPGHQLACRSWRRRKPSTLSWPPGQAAGPANYQAPTLTDETPGTIAALLAAPRTDHVVWHRPARA
jgi:hypothetical protein